MRLPRHATLLLTAFVLLSVGLRLLSAAAQGNSVEALPGITDQLSYHALACRVLEGKGFSFGSNWWPATRADEPTAHWSFLYTLYLTGTYALFGVHPLVPRLLQAAMVGVLQPWLSWRISKRLFNEQVALFAAAISAVYAYFIYYAGALMTEAFYIVTILWVFDTAIRLAEQPGGPGEGGGGYSLWLSLGLAVGLTVMLRQVFLMFVPLLLAWLLLAKAVTRNRQQGNLGRTRLELKNAPVKSVLLSIGVMALLVVPWSIRNYLVFDQFVLLNTNAGFAFFWGNHPVHGTSFIPILPKEGPGYGDLLPPELRGLNEASMDRQLLKMGLRFVLDEPGRYLWLSLSRIAEYFKFWPTADSSTVSNVARVLSFGILAPFMVVGIAVAVKRLASSEGYGFAANRTVPLLLFVFAYSLVHCLSWTLVRYRLPVDGVLVIFAASGLVASLSFITGLQKRKHCHVCE